MVLELIYSGESLQHFHPFQLKPIVNVYSSMIRTADFTIGLVIIALNYAMLVVFGMTSPFIIEHVFHYSPVVSGYSALFSGIALMAGGIISKALIRRPLVKKVTTAIFLQILFAGLMIVVAGLRSNLFTMMPFVLIVHLLAGFIFNNIFSYCLGRFSKNAGIASGITGGSLFIITSFFSYGIVDSVSIKNQGLLGGAYLGLALLIGVTFFLFMKVQYRQAAFAKSDLSKAA